MSDIVLISGSPTADSRSDIILDFIGSTLQHNGYPILHISITDIPAEQLMYGHYDSNKIQKMTEQINQAAAIVIASPVYKASYTGALKALLDILPQHAFKDKDVLPIMIGGSRAHLLALEYTLKPLIAILKGQSLNGVYIVDQQISKKSSPPITDQDIYDRIHLQITQLIAHIEKRNASILH